MESSHDPLENSPTTNPLLTRAEEVVNMLRGRLPAKRKVAGAAAGLLGPILLTACAATVKHEHAPLVQTGSPHGHTISSHNIHTRLIGRDSTPRHPMHQDTSHEHAKSFTHHTAPEVQPKLEMIDGIPVYGLQDQISTTAELEQLNNYFNKGFSSRLQDILTSKHLPNPEDLTQERELVLDPTKRYLQIMVTKSMFENFTKDIPHEDISLPAWFSVHVDKMNQFLHDAKPVNNLGVVLSRIIVVGDNFADNSLHQQNLPSYPHDIDAEWNDWKDVRGGKNQPPLSGSLQKETLPNGKQVTFDYGTIHEWDHQLLNWDDEYIQEFGPLPHIPGLRVAGSSGTTTRTPWFGYAMKRIADLKIRGYYTDPRGLGTLGIEQHTEEETKEAAESVWGIHPDKNSLRFVDAEGNPIKGEVIIQKNHNSSGYYGTKSFSMCQKAKAENGVIRLDDVCFTPDRSGYSVVYPTDWAIEINAANGKEYKLNMPAAGFNMSGIAGVQDANYTIQFADSAPVTDKTQFQELTMLQGKDNLDKTPFDYGVPTTPYASMKVDGTDVTFDWKISDE